MILSIIIPCYNMESYIKRCYNSLQIQIDADDVEFIFVNDGSTDNTLSILQVIEKSDNRVVIVNKNNAGVSVARNEALKIAKGEYIYLLDPDDYLSTLNVIKNIKCIISEYKPDIIIPANNREINNEIRFKPLPFSDGIHNIYDIYNNCTIFPTQTQLFYKSSLIKKNNITFNPDIKCAEVYTFTIQCLKFANNCYVYNKPCQNYFYRIEGATKKINYSNDLSVLRALEIIHNDGKEFYKYSSFRITALKNVFSFTYNKYIKFPIDVKMKEKIKLLLSNNLLREYLKSIAFGRKIPIKERSFAMYIYLMPKILGFKLLKLVIKRNRNI